MKIKISVTLVVTLVLLFLAWGSECIAAVGIAPDEEGVYLISAKDIPRMSVDQLKSRLNDPSLILIDVRSPGDWNTSLIKIKGAFREVPDKENEWALKYDKDKTIVLYCA
jgi:predicted sulfurtransferase